MSFVLRYIDHIVIDFIILRIQLKKISHIKINIIQVSILYIPATRDERHYRVFHVYSYLDILLNRDINA